MYFYIYSWDNIILFHTAQYTFNIRKIYLNIYIGAKLN